MIAGKFITIEGQDGSGKTTNLEYLCTYLEQQGINIVVTREPGGTELGEAIRELLLGNQTLSIADKAELLLIFAARAQHLSSVIQPALAAGKWVVCDRFTDATYAYQGAGRAIDYQDIATLEAFVQDGLKPDLTLLLDVDISIGQQRVQDRSKQQSQVLDRFEQQQLDFKQRVRQHYLGLADNEPDRVKLINAEQSLADVQQSITVTVNNFINKNQ
ncbi:MAG: dTMP kinase [Arenicella sp.]